LGRQRLKIVSNKPIKEEENNLTLLHIVRRIARIPAFVCLVGQGIFGAIPWDMMSFLILLLDWKKFTRDQVVIIQFTNGVSGTIGGALGGVLGDFAAKDHDMLGRIAVAFVSVVGGAFFFGLFLFSNTYTWSLVWSNLFQLWGGWTPAATNRPLCADLARSPSERAQIVAAWILLEKTSAAVFGAPLVGYITEHMIDKESRGTLDKAEALAFNMFFLSSLFWIISHGEFHETTTRILRCT
jgi:MFS family permease